MKNALEAAVYASHRRLPLVGVEGEYSLPSTSHRAPSVGASQADVIVVGRPTRPSDGPVPVAVQFMELFKRADDRLRVGGTLVLSAGYTMFRKSSISKRYMPADPDKLRIYLKVSGASTVWLQRGTQTGEEHYKYLFDVSAELFGDQAAEKNVLSFGCSTGEEVRALEKRGFAAVHGVEINPQAIAKAKAADPKGVYVEDLDDLPLRKYDLIFTVAVLCSFPSRDPVGEFPFSVFMKTLEALDARLSVGGYLLIGSVQYDFRDAQHLSARYEPVILDNPLLRYYASGRIPKWTPDGFIRPLEATIAEGAVPVVYRKLADA